MFPIIRAQWITFQNVESIFYNTLHIHKSKITLAEVGCQWFNSDKFKGIIFLQIKDHYKSFERYRSRKPIWERGRIERVVQAGDKYYLPTILLNNIL